jgi:hypothetical protein
MIVDVTEGEEGVVGGRTRRENCKEHEKRDVKERRSGRRKRSKMSTRGDEEMKQEREKLIQGKKCGNRGGRSDKRRMTYNCGMQ